MHKRLQQVRTGDSDTPLHIRIGAPRGENLAFKLNVIRFVRIGCENYRALTGEPVLGTGTSRCLALDSVAWMAWHEHPLQRQKESALAGGAAGSVPPGGR
jgi:hypothetical protein